MKNSVYVYKKELIIETKLLKSLLPPHFDIWKSLSLQASVYTEIGKREEANCSVN
jgi:hypothetical protein